MAEVTINEIWVSRFLDKSSDPFGDRFESHSFVQAFHDLDPILVGEMFVLLLHFLHRPGLLFPDLILPLSLSLGYFHFNFHCGTYFGNSLAIKI